MAKLILLIEVDGNQIASVEALSVPARGDRVWVATSDGKFSAVVANIEHQWDMTRAETFGAHYVIVNCSTERA